MTNYELEFSDQEIEEIEALGYTDGPKPRIEWIRLAQLALGKADMIDMGYYDDGSENDEDDEDWAAELRLIANMIMRKFKPGDGQI